ncbi:hypothetical protein QWY99_10435 [Flavobacterium branchiarum]|uniref:Uncharacterized protein n=1 Tax=Flavobacterium branchiarum TaxID=1114870 RepID=A0ABV5FTE1_9FLAO|nr:hypothetical protein [Flavobacterium branchiarum]MDN3673470.1 hypothetical protein [Flavobacterium branchiarum]
MNNKYKYCHRILKFLYDDRRTNNQQEKLIGSIKIAESTNIPILKIHEVQHILVNKGDIVVIDNDGQSMMSIQQQGMSSYIDKKYLKDSAKEFWDGIFNWVRIIIPLGALILSIMNFISNKAISKRIDKIEIQLKKVETINKNK